MNLSALWQRMESCLDSSRLDWRKRVDELGQLKAVRDRAAGRKWNDDEIFHGLLMAVLSSNTDWSKIERIQKTPDFAELFSRFSLEWYAGRRPGEIDERFVPWFQKHKAGSVSQARALVDLIATARKLLEHSCTHGSAESYFTALVQWCDGDPKRAALHLGLQDDEYKLPAFGVALAAEALKNLGFDVAKPDRHVGRAVGSFGLVPFGGWSKEEGRAAPSLSSRTSLLAVMTAVQEIAAAAYTPVALVDNAIWLLGAQSGLYLTNPELAAIARESGVAEGHAESVGALIDSWVERDDHGEQRETIECLIEGLDRDRLSERELFPEELKGRSW